MVRPTIPKQQQLKQKRGRPYKGTYKKGRSYDAGLPHLMNYALYVPRYRCYTQVFDSELPTILSLSSLN